MIFAMAACGNKNEPVEEPVEQPVEVAAEMDVAGHSFGLVKEVVDGEEISLDGIDSETFVFADDGTFANILVAGGETVGEYTGTFEQSGSDIVITWSDGTSQTLTIDEETLTYEFSYEESGETHPCVRTYNLVG